MSNKYIVERAKELYYRRIGYKESMFPYMWGQCSPEYQQAWLTLAKIELEDEYNIAVEMQEREYNNR